MFPQIKTMKRRFLKMKKMVAMLLTAVMLVLVCAAYAEDGTEDFVAQITGKIDDGAYVLSLKVDPKDT